MHSSNGFQDVFDASSLLSDATIDILALIMVLGMDHNEIDTITIDQIIEKIRNYYDYTSAENKMSSINNIEQYIAATSSLRTENLLLTRRARRAWFNKQFAEEVLANE
jgi:hypothetical protein